MITQVSNSQDTLKALNENLEGLLTGKRKLPVVKEVNNTLGKFCNVVKMEIMHKVITGDKTPLEFFSNSGKKELQAVKK